MLTLFSFGYYGWGNATPQLVQAADSVERRRGFKPPIFVDIRIRREVRAIGFSGNAFGNLLGDKRHQWMKALGNRHIESGTGPRIQIAEPTAVNALLDLAMQAAADRRRIIFFCSCEWPRLNARVNCHRSTVAGLMLRAAKRRGLSVEVAEWLGGKPGHVDLGIDPQDFNKLLCGKLYIPPNGMSLGESAGLAWGSTAKVNCKDQHVKAVIGPAQFRRQQWQLPVLYWDDSYNLAGIRHESVRVRKGYGFEAKHS